MRRQAAGVAAIAAVVWVLASSPLAGTQPEPYEMYSVLPLTGGSSYTNVRIRDSLLVLQSILNKSGGIAGRPIHFHGFAGINGFYDFRDGLQHGLNRSEGVVARWFPEKNDWIAVSRPGGEPL